MLGRLKLLAPFIAALSVAGCNAGGLSVPVMTGQSASQVHPIPQWQAQNLAHRACPEVLSGEVQCQLLIMNEAGRPKVYGLGAPDIEAAYNLPSSSKGSEQIVAVVDSFDNPNVASDLAVYRRHYGLPKAKFYKYNQDGQQSHYPKGNEGWGAEIDLDVEMVSASCPNCTIYLIETSPGGRADNIKAEREAVKLGAHIISNSFSCSTTGCPSIAFDTPGITYVAAAGDDGYGTSAPMAYATVVSAGGTILSKSGPIYNEVVWPDTGGGCATQIAKPLWQHDPGCSGRTANDVAAVAWNVASYDTYGESGWYTASGTSVSAPIVAGIFGLAGNATKQDGGKIFWTLSKKKLQEDVHIIASGNDDCPPRLRGSYLCTAGTDEFGSYSGPTGWGTPNDIGAF
ncbi:MAG: S8 family serine peptidase [Candidatus Cybelea sp.]|jgi:subtilase family serine protease